MINKHTSSVSDLVEQMLRVGDLKTGLIYNDILQERAQSDFEHIREEDFEFSVPVSYLIKNNDFSYSINGIINGLCVLDNVLSIEIIEFTNEPLHSFVSELDIIAWSKAKLLGHMILQKNHYNEITIQINWYQKKNFQTVEQRVEYTRAELKEYFDDLIQRYLEWAQPYHAWTYIRDESIKKCEFPFVPYRPGQRTMMTEVYHAISTNSSTLVQAPTGIGKTLASLFPAIKSLESGFTSKIFYLTARTTGRAISEESLLLLHGKGLRIKSVTITAKEKICARKKKKRECDDCHLAKGYYTRVRDAIGKAFRKDLITREIVETLAAEYMICPFEFSLDLSVFTDIIICDYNYVFDPNVYLKRFFNGENLDTYTFLVDEAHNLVDRGRNMFSAIIEKHRIFSIRMQLDGSQPDICVELDSVLEIIEIHESNCENQSDTITEKNAPTLLLKKLRLLIRTIEDWIGRKEKGTYKKELFELYFDLKHFAKIGMTFDELYATIYEKSGPAFSITLFCLNPAPKLRQGFKRAKSKAVFSATISPMYYFKNILGLPEDTRTCIIPSPFPKENMCLLCADTVSTLYSRRPFTQNDVIKSLAALIFSAPGNYIAFFPSYKYMETVHRLFKRDFPHCKSILQTPNMPEKKRHKFIETFHTFSSEPLLGFAVMGGIFGEGIDLVGERLKGAVIVSVGLPGLSPERDLIREYFNIHKCGFEYAYLYPGMNKVLQAAGRVIRTENDRGIILLIDDRFATSRYYSLFPKEWEPVSVKNEKDITDKIRKFEKKH